MFVSWKEFKLGDFGDFFFFIKDVVSKQQFKDAVRFCFFSFCTIFIHFTSSECFFSLLPVVLPSKQSTANSFGQMQITSLTSQPKSILQQER